MDIYDEFMQKIEGARLRATNMALSAFHIKDDEKAKKWASIGTRLIKIQNDATELKS